MLNSLHTSQWYVINTKPNQEKRAVLNLMNNGVEVFYPQTKIGKVNQFSKRITYVTKSLFPSYIFAKFVAGEMLNKIKYTRGINQVVQFDKKPCVIDSEVIDLIKERSDKNGFVCLQEEFSEGDKVMIDKPHLRNFVGIFEKEISNQKRVSILLNAISYQVRITVERHYVKKL